ncbi:YbbR domain-containing protein [Salibacterium salarium]|uniref:CdaR family protein n=1 Tax=Salibacterium salarium TaxID=284579 RepID=UPI002788A6A5|nr:CdaR family protein [Salibacterium salarium]MDQ0300318.1 YbbR domain-containing protein [Salibacterium salarium]
MDRLFNNHWFVRLVSLLIAIMLYTMVNMDNVSNQPGVLPDNEESSYMLNNVDVQVYYNEDEYEIVDMDETVNVELTGPQTSIMLFQLSRPSFEVYADLEDQGEGSHNVRLQHRDFPADLDVSISPRISSIELQEQKTISYPVDVQVLNEEDIEEGYNLGEAEVSPGEVDIKAPQATHEQIDTVRTSVDVAGADERVEAEADVIAYDSAGNEVDISTQPESVSVEIPIDSPNVQVPISLSREGTLSDNLSIVSLNVEETEASIYGPLDVINEINSVEAVLDLSEIEENGTMEIPVNSPEGIDRVEPETIEVEVEVGEREETVFEDVPIEVENMPDEYSYTITEPEESVSDVTVYGSSEVLEALDAEDISLTVDWEDAEEDNSPVTLSVYSSGPTEVRAEPDIDEVEVEWSDETSSEEEAGESNE